jgi:hypothetical protein
MEVNAPQGSEEIWPYALGSVQLVFHQQPQTLSFMCGRETPVLVMHPDGRIEVDASAPQDEAAEAFLDCLRVAFPLWVESLKGEK